VNKITNFIFNQVGVPKFEKYLDLASFSHKLTSGNVANVSTPGYRRRSIDFQAEFNRLTGNSNRLSGVMTDSTHIPTGDHISRPPDIQDARVIEGEMNSVDVDQEISRMVQNELLFSIGARLLKNKLNGLRKAITSK
ncbi:MAG: flagellar basal body rod protein FlgB, partial [candidate division Zixibacteria bacterium]|nr:flagellar basal body rod protein FlgB [candidate division Zixibacteria bacterium]